jgi:hypothetical protein
MENPNQILNNINLLNSNKPFDIEQNIIIKSSIGYKYFKPLLGLDEIVEKVNDYVINGKDGRIIYKFVQTQILKIVYQNHKLFYESNYFIKIKYDDMMLNKDDMILCFDGSDEKHEFLIKLLKYYGYR